MLTQTDRPAPLGETRRQSQISSIPSVALSSREGLTGADGSETIQSERAHENKEDDVETLTNSEEDLRIPRRKGGSNEKEELVPLMR